MNRTSVSILSGCPAGYLGPNCTIPCDPPGYGVGCQFTCACKGSETCHPSFGCVLPTTTTTETTTKITTTKVTTIIETTTKMTTTTEDDIRTTEADEVATSRASATIKTANVAVGETLPTSTGNRMYRGISDSQNIMLIGLFVLCGFFIVLFAVFVGTQIRSKCFNKNTLTTQSTTGVNLKSYDVINADQPPGVDDMSQVNTKPGRRDSHYTEINTCNYTENVHKKNNEPLPCQSNINVHLQAEDATAQDRTVPKYVEIVGSPKNSTRDPEFSASENTYSKQLYLSAI
ncbi:uncharacterized protein LOC128180412 isoform X3 [Crassostrea angulata]|uniref:uncharacterized protein LOC128180412 isoform X3 n=1 Tax=Magallana angulata TaxID=2784310 RepID=UPI0022B1DA01|nr:uncharacterized protein LOC128180412 isoform X3 [Crassostrea angulata]